MKNLKALERQMRALTKKRDSQLSLLTSVSDKTRNQTASIENGLYVGQMALSIFRNLTNRHLSARKRFTKIGVTLATFIAAAVARKYFVKKKA